MAKTVLVLGTLDTKAAEFAYLADLIRARGHRAVVMNTGVKGEPGFEPEITAEQVAEAGGSTLVDVRASTDRGSALEIMGNGARAIAIERQRAGEIDGVISLGGSGGSSIAARAMQGLPVGVPKLLVSTMASGNTTPYVGVKDVTLMYSVVDVAGLNRLSRRILANAAGAICGMVEQEVAEAGDRPLVTATMFGVTTPAVDHLRERLEAAGYEVLVFHATGSGGRAMESLVSDGFIAGVADVTTTEWCDELVGGELSAGPERLEAAGRAGIPQVVSLGALDMVNFGPADTVPERFRGRTLYYHNPTVTLMRTTAGECRELGEIIGRKVNAATGPTAVFVPLRGVSQIDAEGMPFWLPDADAALFDALRATVDRSKAELVELDVHINDPAFSDAMADRLIAMLGAR